MTAEALFDVLRGALDDDDRVIDDDADRQHDGEQGREVDGETQRRHRGEGADDGDRNGRGGNKCDANVLQEDQNDDQHQHAGLDQRAIDLVHRGGDELRGVERDVVAHPPRKAAGQIGHLALDLPHHRQRVGARRLEHRQTGGWFAVRGEGLRVGLRAEFHVADIANPGDRAVRAGFHDDVLELRHVGQPAGDVQGVLEALPGCRRGADLAGGDLRALLLQRGGDVADGQSARLHQPGIEPDAHGVLASAEHHHGAYSRQPSDFLLQVDRGVVAEIEAVILAVGRGQGDDTQDRGRSLLDVDTLRLHRLRQRGHGTRHAVLHQHLGVIQVGADGEGDDQRVGAVAGAGGLHV